MRRIREMVTLRRGQPAPADPQDAHSGERTRIARASARSFAFRIVAGGVSFLTVYVTARGFGPDGRGIYALTSLSLSLMLSVLGGTSHALAAELAHRRATMSQLCAAGLTVAVVGGTFIAAAVIAFDTLIYDWPADHVFEFAAAALPAALLVDFVIWLHLTAGDVRRMHWLHLAQVAVPLAGLALAATIAPDEIYFAMALWVIAFWLLAVIGIVERHRDIGLDFHRIGSLVRHVVKRGARISFGNGITQLNYRIDLLVVATLLPLEAVGRYSVALALGETLWLLSRAVMTGAYSAVMAASTQEESVSVSTQAFRHSLGALSLAAVVLGLVASFLIVPIFGEEFAGVWVPLLLLLPGIVAYGVVEILREFFIVRLERVREYLVMGVSSAITNMTLAVILIGPLGLAGVAISTSLSYVAAGSYLLFRFSRLTGTTHIRAFLPARSEFGVYRHLFASLFRVRRQGA